jgi:uncharacterized protein YdeI (YjbR/CyaY-like superfamily)
MSVKPAKVKAEQPQVAPAAAKAWSAWLAKHHAKSDGVWIVFTRDGAKKDALTYPQAVEASLCYGWIDGQSKRIDATHWKQRYTPRRARSKWSKLNRDKAEALIRAKNLIRAKKMKPAGLREIERAKADGRWDAAYDAPSKATVPPDLAKALAKNKKAKAFFATLNGQNRYAILHRVQTAVKPETRAKRIEKFVAMLADGKKIYE